MCSRDSRFCATGAIAHLASKPAMKHAFCMSDFRVCHSRVDGFEMRWARRLLAGTRPLWRGPTRSTGVVQTVGMPPAMVLWAATLRRSAPASEDAELDMGMFTVGYATSHV